MRVGSDVPGFRLENFDTLCPKTGEQCPVQQQQVLDYVGHVTPESDTEEAEADRRKLTIKLMEYRLAAPLIDYDGVAPGVCQTRLKMDDSKPRKRVLSIARGIRNLTKGNRE